MFGEGDEDVEQGASVEVAVGLIVMGVSALVHGCRRWVSLELGL